jgi:hypothetical protein
MFCSKYLSVTGKARSLGFFRMAVDLGLLSDRMNENKDPGGCP